LLTCCLMMTITFVSCLVPEDTVQNETAHQEIMEHETDRVINIKYKIDPSHDFQGTVANWFDFKRAANSVTLDDGTYDQYAAAFPVMESLGIKGTFYIAAHLIDRGVWNDNGTLRKMMSWDNAAKISKAGHEIGSHSLNHLDMSKSGVDLEEELSGSRIYIENKIPGIKVETFCWPHWRETIPALKAASKVYISARTGNGIISYYLQRNGGIPSDPPENMFKVNAFGFLNSHTKREWKALIDDIYEKGSWFVSSYHGVDDGYLPEDHLGWNPLSTDLFTRTLKYPVEKGFWIDTFANVSKYIFERDNAVLHLKNRGFSIELTLEDGLDDMVYNQMLSISFKIPESWTIFEIRNEHNEIISYREEENVVFLNIFPDGTLFELKPLLTEGELILE